MYELFIHVTKCFPSPPILLIVILVGQTLTTSSHSHNHNDLHTFNDESRGLHETIRTCHTEELDIHEREKHEKEIQEYRMKLTKETWDDIRTINITIPVYFHVYTDSFGNGTLEDEIIYQQMDILNDAFQGSPSNYSECGFSYEDFPASPFLFTLVNITRIQDDEVFELESSISQRTRRIMHFGGCESLNIYTGNADFLGFARYPFSCAPAGNTDPNVVNRGDSVILHYGSLPEGTLSRYNEGDTLIHEVGHWLGLFHTFTGGCEGDGDFVDDTPSEETSASGCPIGRDTCFGGGIDPIHNFMNYVDDCCMYRFTSGQIERMIIEFDVFRSPIPSSFPSAAPSASPTTIFNTIPHLIASIIPSLDDVVYVGNSILLFIRNLIFNLLSNVLSNIT